MWRNRFRVIFSVIFLFGIGLWLVLGLGLVSVLVYIAPHFVNVLRFSDIDVLNICAELLLATKSGPYLHHRYNSVQREFCATVDMLGVG